MKNDTTMVSIRVSPEIKQKIKDIIFYKKEKTIKALIERLVEAEHKLLKKVLK